MAGNYEKLLKYMDGMKVFNTHSHHYPQSEQADMDLMKMLHLTYLKDDIKEGKIEEGVLEDFIERMKYNSYFTWLEKGIQTLYDIKDPLKIPNIEKTDTAIKKAYGRFGHNIRVLEDGCCYEHMIVDAYWKPGEVSDMSDIFLSAYRINMYLYGYNRFATDHNGNNPYQVNQWESVKSLDEYIAFMHEELEKQIHKGCVALKCAAAYDRGLNFRKTNKENAEKAFLLGKNQEFIRKEEMIDFQNYIFYDICKFAAEHQIPIQCHTGLGLLYQTSAIYLQEVISDNPDTKFTLFHGNYPWMDDLCGLVCTYRNVYVDFCWLPIISTCEAGRFLEKIMDIGDISKICWGCDTWLAENSYGALLAMKHVLGTVLGKKIDSGMLNYQSAENICQKILFENANQLYLN